MTTQGVTHVVRLTPAGRGAIATLLVTGPGATALVASLLHSSSGPLAARPLDAITYGRWSSAAAGEEVVVCRRAAEHVEIHCHGGHAASRAIIDSLCAAGCVETDWRQWVRAAAIDPIRAEAEIALACASTLRVAEILCDQRAGALRAALAQIAAHLATSEVDHARACVEQLLALAPLGLHLVEPWRVVFAGSPNVGKSSLINALLGYERAIVHPTPGTTRDVVSTLTAFDGWPVELSDTAGLRDDAEPLETAGIDLARRQLAAADLVVLVADASTSMAAALARLSAGDCRDALRVFNKCDLLPPGCPAPDAVGQALFTSALRGEGIAQLQAEIVRRLVPALPTRGQAMPFLACQVAALERMRDLLVAVRPAEAAAILADNRHWVDQDRGDPPC
ncbi:MAG: GTPase [Pirellulales bacterium]